MSTNLVRMEHPAPTPAMNLYDVVETVMQLFDELEVATDEERTGIEAALEKYVAVDLANKVDGLAFSTKRCDAEDALLADFIKEATKRRQSWAKRKGRTRDLILWAMKRTGVSLLKGKMHSFSVRAGSETLCIQDEGQIPEEYRSVNVAMSLPLWKLITKTVPDEVLPHLSLGAVETTALNTAAIKQALKSGKQVPGAILATGDDVLTVR